MLNFHEFRVVRLSLSRDALNIVKEEYMSIGIVYCSSCNLFAQFSTQSIEDVDMNPQAVYVPKHSPLDKRGLLEHISSQHPELKAFLFHVSHYDDVSVDCGDPRKFDHICDASNDHQIQVIQSLAKNLSTQLSSSIYTLYKRKSAYISMQCGPIVFVNGHQECKKFEIVETYC
jgi:hypothetical protein